MKSFFVTLLILGATFLGYDYFLAPPLDRVVFPRPPVVKEVAQTESKTDAPAPADAKPKTPEAVPVKSPVAASTTTPATTTSAQPEVKSGFRPPVLDSIEKMTGGWKSLPKTAFPRPVTLLKDTTFTLSFGASTVRSGTQAVALSMDNGLLVVSPSEGSPARNSVAVDDTDLKNRLTPLYEQWKIDRIEDARKQYEEMLRQPKPEASTLVDAAGKPSRSGNGAYPLLLASLRSGNPSSITPTNIVKWGSAEEAPISATPTWIIPVTYKAKTLFGDMIVETVVHVQKGKVVAWNYKGSGEPVP